MCSFLKPKPRKAVCLVINGKGKKSLSEGPARRRRREQGPCRRRPGTRRAPGVVPAVTVPPLSYPLTPMGAGAEPRGGRACGRRAPGRLPAPRAGAQPGRAGPRPHLPAGAPGARRVRTTPPGGPPSTPGRAKTLGHVPPRRRTAGTGRPEPSRLSRAMSAVVLESRRLSRKLSDFGQVRARGRGRATPTPRAPTGNPRETTEGAAQGVLNNCLPGRTSVPATLRGQGTAWGAGAASGAAAGALAARPWAGRPPLCRPRSPVL